MRVFVGFVSVSHEAPPILSRTEKQTYS